MHMHVSLHPRFYLKYINL
uniref:Uncharacterized protein n=1 Tax=Rhizophora mucronata TaxID=61149 RepID=A0A2P2QFN3_RHIMU